VQKFIENILSLIKPMAADNNVTIDDTIIAHIEKIHANDTLFDYFFDLTVNQLQTEAPIFESADEGAITVLCETSNKMMPEAVNPLVIISLVTQIISLINALKRLQTSDALASGEQAW
jgi:hypothetical protein